MANATETVRQELKDQRPSATQEERELTGSQNRVNQSREAPDPSERAWNNWEGDAEFMKAQAAAADLDAEKSGMPAPELDPLPAPPTERADTLTRQRGGGSSEIKAPTGPTGSTAATGPTGPTGPTSATGATGATGRR